MSIQATDIAFAIYPVSDVARSRKFYEQDLGLKPGMSMEFSPGKWWIEYDIGATALAITNFEQPTAGKGPGIALEVADYDAALATVQAAGIPIVWGPNDFPPCRSFAIKDPDGHDLYIHKRKAAA